MKATSVFLKRVLCVFIACSVIACVPVRAEPLFEAGVSALAPKSALPDPRMRQEIIFKQLIGMVAQYNGGKSRGRPLGSFLRAAFRKAKTPVEVTTVRGGKAGLLRHMVRLDGVPYIIDEKRANCTIVLHSRPDVRKAFADARRARIIEMIHGRKPDSRELEGLGQRYGGDHPLGLLLYLQQMAPAGATEVEMAQWGLELLGTHPAPHATRFLRRAIGLLKQKYEGPNALAHKRYTLYAYYKVCGVEQDVLTWLQVELLLGLEKTAEEREQELDTAFAKAGITVEEAEALRQYVYEFLQRHQDCVRQNYYELLFSLLDANRLDIELVSLKQTKEGWSAFGAVHRDFLNAMPLDLRKKLFRAKTNTHPFVAGMVGFLQALSRDIDSLSAAEKEFVEEFLHTPAVAQKISLSDVQDLSSARAFDLTRFVYGIDVALGGKRLTFIVKGEPPTQQEQGKSIADNEKFYMDYLRVLGLRHVTTVAYSSLAGGRVLGMVFMQRFPGEQTRRLFDGHGILKEDLLGLKDPLLEDFARIAAANDFVGSADRTVPQRKMPQFPGNYMVDVNAYQRDTQGVIKLDNEWVFQSDEHMVLRGNRMRAETEIGFVARLPEFYTSEAARYRLLVRFMDDYIYQWRQILDARRDVERLIVQTYGEKSSQHEYFLAKIQSDPMALLDTLARDLFAYYHYPYDSTRVTQALLEELRTSAPETPVRWMSQAHAVPPGRALEELGRAMADLRGRDVTYRLAFENGRWVLNAGVTAGAGDGLQPRGLSVSGVLRKLEKRQKALAKKGVSVLAWTKEEIQIAREAGLDTRPIQSQLLQAAYVGHDMAVKNIANPDNENKTAVYGAAGADWSHFILSTNANEAYFVDHNRVDAEKLQRLLRSSWEKIGEPPSRYKRAKYKLGFGVSTHGTMLNMEVKILLELRAMGVKKLKKDGSENITIEAKDDGTVTIRFEWAYRGKKTKKYSITYIPADITKPQEYPQRLRDVLDKGIDIYYQRAAFNAAADYEKFLPHIAACVKTGGFLLTDDRMIRATRTGLAEAALKNVKGFLGIGGNVVMTKEMGLWEKFIKTYLAYGPTLGYGQMVAVRQKEAETAVRIDSGEVANEPHGSPVLSPSLNAVMSRGRWLDEAA